ncbi:hypothetical protein Esi_0296_0009 [Ectocarpus siliculosus]|uniref:Uncharacterized protein n=1 Tax=Ectocarpus siliculosus TaxID=2880 RepID=D7FVM8_ECTSI|nr:hypothetical protein Esi_0296_0009 [Ectocarpus siliculosus]|eukprot:CBJ31949.1 hypothetical protein Esi_0296_0009 [Ectocarpus siliculosus]
MSFGDEGRWERGAVAGCLAGTKGVSGILVRVADKAVLWSKACGWLASNHGESGGVARCGECKEFFRKSVQKLLAQTVKSDPHSNTKTESLSTVQKKMHALAMEDDFREETSGGQRTTSNLRGPTPMEHQDGEFERVSISPGDAANRHFYMHGVAGSAGYNMLRNFIHLPSPRRVQRLEAQAAPPRTGVLVDNIRKYGRLAAEQDADKADLTGVLSWDLTHLSKNGFDFAPKEGGFTGLVDEATFFNPVYQRKVDEDGDLDKQLDKILATKYVERTFNVRATRSTSSSCGGRLCGLSALTTSNGCSRGPCGSWR